MTDTMAEEEQQPLTLETYQPPLSLWKLVEQHVPKGEQEEVKSMLGYALVELSLDLHQEVETMLEIWQECQASNKLRLAQPRLPEPPAIRDRLVQEICFFVQNVKDKARSKGMDADHIFSKHNTEVIDYALHTSRGGGSGSSSPCDTQRPVSRSSSRASVDLTGEVSSMSKQLNVRHFNEVTAHLREYLESEIQQLKQDVELLQQCVVDEKDEMDGFRPASSLAREPTISELREERTSLEKEWLSQEKLPMSPPQSSSGLSRPGCRAGTHEDDSHACQPNSVLVVKAPGMMAKPTQTQDKASTSHQHSSSGCRPSKAEAKNLHGAKPLTASRLRPIQAETTKAQSSRPGPMRASHAIPAARAVSPTDSVHSSSSSSTDISDSESLTRAGGDAPRQPDTHLARADSHPNEASHGVPFRRRTISPSRVKVVPLGSVVSPQPPEPSTFSPTPPPSAKPNRSRPGSAQRFRNMVMDCREGQ